jgi:outer membrane protein assembly factor BamB
MRPAAVLLAALALAGCGVFSDDDPPLPGNRVPLRQTGRDAPMPADLARPLMDLGPARALAEWPQPNGTASRAPGHLEAPSGLTRAWQTDIGAGSGSSGRITSAPVVAGGKVFALDAAGGVAAVDAGSGRIVWRASIVPEGQGSSDGFGGGVAVIDGRLIVATGFGEVLALGVNDGQVIWRRAVGAPIRSAPAVDDGRVVVVTRDNGALGLRAETGDVLWNIVGTSAGSAGVLQASAPAMAGGLAVLPFTSGELVAVSAASGRVAWADALAGGRRGLARAMITDISGDPVIAGIGVFAANASGQMVAIDARSGRRGWLVPFGSNNPAWVVGQTLFVITDNARLMRLSASTGETIWSTDLPEFEDTGRSRAVAYGGPVVAGGRVFLTSSDDALLVFDPETGREVQRVDIPGSSTGPVIAGGALFVLSDNGTLSAFR